MNLEPPSIPRIIIQPPVDLLEQLIMFQNGVTAGELPKYLYQMIYDMTSSDCKSFIQKNITNLKNAPDKINAILETIKSDNLHNDLKQTDVGSNDKKIEGKNDLFVDKDLDDFVTSKLTQNTSSKKENDGSYSKFVNEHSFSSAKDKNDDNFFANDKSSINYIEDNKQIGNETFSKNKMNHMENSDSHSRQVDENLLEKNIDHKNLQKDNTQDSNKSGESKNETQKERMACDGNLEKNNFQKPQNDLHGLEKRIETPEDTLVFEKQDGNDSQVEKQQKQGEFSKNSAFKQTANKPLQSNVGTNAFVIKQEALAKPLLAQIGNIVLPFIIQHKIKPMLSKTLKFKFKKVKKREKGSEDKKDDESEYHHVDDIS